MDPKEEEAMIACRCGWNGEGDHPCHGNGYRCRKPAQIRFITYPTALAGMQLKLDAYETFACDECWNEKQKIERGKP
jgi:hypothetical protein